MTATPNALAGRRVLLVEDDFFIADDLRYMFEKAGAEVLGPVPTVDRALDLIAATPVIDGAVLDINLQDVEVFPVADALQSRGIPLVFATGYEKTIIPVRFAEAKHCEKPIKPDRIAQALFG
jgi:CheY-like chemotaxis protein